MGDARDDRLHLPVEYPRRYHGRSDTRHGRAVRDQPDDLYRLSQEYPDRDVHLRRQHALGHLQEQARPKVRRYGVHPFVLGRYRLDGGHLGDRYHPDYADCPTTGAGQGGAGRVGRSVSPAAVGAHPAGRRGQRDRRLCPHRRTAKARDRSADHRERYQPDLRLHLYGDLRLGHRGSGLGDRDGLCRRRADRADLLQIAQAHGAFHQSGVGSAQTARQDIQRRAAFRTDLCL